MSKKTIAITCFVLLICCCGSVGLFFGLLGNIEANGKCIYKGPLNNNPTGACIPNYGGIDDRYQPNDSSSSASNSGLTKYSGSQSAKYSFEYDEEAFRLTDGSSPSLAAKVTDLDGIGFGSNINFNSQVGSLDITDSLCTNFTNQVIDALEVNSRKIDLLDVSVVTLDSGEKACRAEWDIAKTTTVGALTQVQYLTSTQKELFIVTLTAYQENGGMLTLEDIARSFVAK